MVYWSRGDVTVETKGTPEVKKTSVEPPERLIQTQFAAWWNEVGFSTKRSMQFITWREILQPSIELVVPSWWVCIFYAVFFPDITWPS